MALVVVGCLLFGLVGPARADVNETADRLRETRERLERAETGLETVTGQISDAQTRLAAVDRRLTAAAQEQARLDGLLDAARDDYRRATARTRAVTDQLQAATRRLRAATSRLDRREGLLGDRVAAVYKHGMISYADALVGSRDVADFTTNVRYVRAAVAEDQRLIDTITGLVRTISDRRAEIDALRDAAAARQEQARIARGRLDRLVADQHRTTRRLDRARQEHLRVVTELESSRERYTDLVASLEAESQRLADELRRSRWDAGVALGDADLAWPTTGRPGSGFGMRVHPIHKTRRLHAGVDIAAPAGQEIVAAADGLVVHAGRRGGYGLTVVIAHGNRLATLYAHQSHLEVSAGDVVTQGQLIGHVGSTGLSTGPHLHLETRVDGAPVDPMDWFATADSR